MLVRPVGKNQPLPWNKRLLVGQKKPLQPKHVWSIRVRLEVAHMWRDLALFNLAIDSKLRACDLVKLRIDKICSGAKVRDRATVVQKKTGRPVQFEITEQTTASLEVWLRMIRTTGSRYLFPSRLHTRPHLSTRQYSRLVHRWVDSIDDRTSSEPVHIIKGALHQENPAVTVGVFRFSARTYFARRCIGENYRHTRRRNN
jgi:integrase